MSNTESYTGSRSAKIASFIAGSALRKTASALRRAISPAGPVVIGVGPTALSSCNPFSGVSRPRGDGRKEGRMQGRKEWN